MVQGRGGRRQAGGLILINIGAVEDGVLVKGEIYCVLDAPRISDSLEVGRRYYSYTERVKSCLYNSLSSISSMSLNFNENLSGNILCHLAR